mmetsp:Transcript_100873/g.261040  ORF Transcript_100873/g.261040 Transcript_100873/m.261040 type:complete len:588 (+) Transcript_100873:125-1888(+)
MAFEALLVVLLPLLQSSEAALTGGRPAERNLKPGVFGVQAVDTGFGQRYGDGYPVTESQKSMRTFGEARYPDTVPMPSWGDLYELGKLGAACDPGKNPQSECGRDLVCRQGICRHCQKDDECPSLHTCVGNTFGHGKCRPNPQKAWERAASDPYEGLCTFAIFLASALAAAAGTGGGGMFVPLLVSLSGLKTDKAVPCSQFMILCGSVVNLAVFLSQRHPRMTGQPVIDYDCVVLLEPLLCLGVMAGVMVNQMSPQWLLLLLLLMTLGFALWRTASKGIRQLRTESSDKSTPPGPAAAPPPQASASRISPTQQQPRRNSRSCGDELISKDFLQLTNMKAWQVILTVVVWLAMLASSFHGLPVCSWKFAVFLVQLAAVLFFCTYVAGCRIQRAASADDAEEGLSSSKGPIDWTASGLWHFPSAAFAAGFLGGLLGLGGGIIMSPVLLEVGMHSEAVQATTAVFVFLSSSLATIQFARLQQHVWHYAIWYGGVTIVATMVGQYLCDVYVRKRGRYSIITLAIAGVLFASLAALLVIGIGQVMEDFYMGRQMWFSTEQLCNKDGLGIVAVDIMPAEHWPSDLARWKHGPP